MDKYVYEKIIRFKTVKNEEIKSIGFCELLQAVEL